MCTYQLRPAKYVPPFPILCFPYTQRPVRSAVSSDARSCLMHRENFSERVVRSLPRVDPQGGIELVQIEQSALGAGATIPSAMQPSCSKTCMRRCMSVSQVRGTPRLELFVSTTNPPVCSGGTKYTRLIPVDYFQALVPAFRMYLRISFMMLSMVRQVRRYGPP